MAQGELKRAGGAGGDADDVRLGDVEAVEQCGERIGLVLWTRAGRELGSEVAEA